MSAIAFDTLTFAKELKKAGFTEQQAEVLAKSQAKLINEKLVTREYFELRVKELEMRLTLRLGSMMVVAIGMVATLVNLL